MPARTAPRGRAPPRGGARRCRAWGVQEGCRGRRGPAYASGPRLRAGLARPAGPRAMSARLVTWGEHRPGRTVRPGAAAVGEVRLCGRGTTSVFPRGQASESCAGAARRSLSNRARRRRSRQPAGYVRNQPMRSEQPVRLHSISPAADACARRLVAARQQQAAPPGEAAPRRRAARRRGMSRRRAAP